MGRNRNKGNHFSNNKKETKIVDVEKDDISPEELYTSIHAGTLPMKNIITSFYDGYVGGDFDNFFRRYKKEEILRWLDNPAFYQKKLVEISRYLYNVSSHFKRLIKYFARIMLICYNIVPYEDVRNVNVDKFRKNYREICRMIRNMNLRHECLKIYEVCMREDVFYGCVVKDYDYKHFFIQQLPYKYCKITYRNKDGIYGISVDMNYFKQDENRLGMYSEDLKDMYEKFKRNSNDIEENNGWVKLPIDIAFAIKWDESVNYTLPPLIGVLPSLFDLEEYKKLKKVKEDIGNYKLLQMIVPYENGRPTISLNTVKNFYEMVQDRIPENIGVALVPGNPLKEVNFEKSGQTTQDLVEEATNDYFENAGVSSLLFGSSNTSSASIDASTLVDSSYMLGLNRQIERLINYFIEDQFNGKQYFRFELLDVTIFNWMEVLKTYQEQAMNGVSGSITKIAAINNNNLEEIDSLNYLENDIFKLNEKFTPLKSGYNVSSNSNDVGRPKMNGTDLTDEGARGRDKGV